MASWGEEISHIVAMNYALQAQKFIWHTDFIKRGIRILLFSWCRLIGAPSVVEGDAASLLKSYLPAALAAACSILGKMSVHNFFQFLVMVLEYLV